MATRLEKLRQQQEQLAERLKNELAKQKKRERKIDTRRKVLLGAFVQFLMEKDEEFKASVYSRLPSFLTRQVDREVFGFSAADDVAYHEKSAPEKAKVSAA